MNRWRTSNPSLNGRKWSGRNLDLTGMKLNTNGRYIQEYAKAGIGGIIRDDKGEIIQAFVVTVNCNNNNMTETVATNYSVKMCKALGITDIDIEVDVLQNSCQHDTQETTTNLNLRSKVERISHNMSLMNATIKDCYMEANHVANGLAKYALMHDIGLHFDSFQALPKEIKGAYQLDKHQMPSLRIRYDKSNFFVS